jgi:hypothetical protein
MSATIKIGSNNYSGQTADITFFPETGGTISIGNQIIPYNYITDYFYGTYNLYFADFDYTCVFIISSADPIPSYTDPTPSPKTYGFFGKLQQDPELLPTEILNQTEYSGLTTDIKLEQYFGGSFIGDISAFRFYSEPLNASQIKHNYKLLKSKYTLLDPDCPNCILPTPSQTPSNTPTPTVTPTNTVTPTITPSETPTNTPTPTVTPTPTLYISPTPTSTQTPTPTSTQTPTQTPTNTPTPSVTPPTIYRAYLFIEPQTGSTNIGQWMYDSGSNFFGFTNDSQPAQDQTIFNFDMNTYVDYMGWTDGTFPSILQQTVPQTTGGVDSYGNPIVAYNFTTTEVSAGTVNGLAWYTWIIPNILTNNLKQYEIDYNPNGNPNLLTAVRTESTIYTYTFNYTGSTIPNTTYRVYTTYPNGIFELNNNQNIYFRGNSLIP